MDATVEQRRSTAPGGLEIIKENRTLADIIVRNTGIRDKSEVGFKVRTA